MKKTIALVTWSGLPEGAESERLLLPHLAARGADAEFVIWRDAARDFSRFDLVILRTCWDYHLRVAEFIEWLRHAASAAPVLNALETVLWNHNKFYLQELEAQGIRIAPTVFFSGRETVSPAGITALDWARILGWKQIVVKPAVSATAHNTWLIDGAFLPTEAELTQRMQSGPFLVQQFIPEIQTQGEISFIYIDGHYSHAVLKRPAAGDFRVQRDFGGSAEPFFPGPELLDQANEIAGAVPQVRDSLYCRIDAVEKSGKLVLMELELIEPELFLGLAEGAAEKFAEAIISRMR
jgi:glutathione synthase/RimK-type ligase-like ATP-grasp enzyme